jgi:hypothetical protein
MARGLYNQRHIAAKIQSAEGVAETLAAADAKAKAINPLISFDPEMFPRNPSRETYTKVGKLVGKKPGSFTFSLPLIGSGTATTEADWFKYIKACGTKVSSLYSITIGAITSGPFQHRELITGGTSGAQGRVIKKTVTGTTTLYYAVVGTVPFQSGEIITGGTSGATATTGTGPTNTGKVIEPLTDRILVPCLTMGGYESPGIRKLLRSCRGNMKWNFVGGNEVLMDYNFMGVEAGVTDLALLSSRVPETQIAPSFLNAAFSIDGVSAKISQMEIDLNNDIQMVDDVNDARGIEAFIIGGRDVVGSFDPEMDLVATHDFYGKLHAGTEMVLTITIGSVSGNKFEFYGKAVQYTDVKDEVRGTNIKVAKSQFDFNGSIVPGDDEWALLCL